MFRFVRAAFGLAALLALSACGHLHLVQEDDEAIVHVGTGLHASAKTADHAGHYTPYALLAAHAYDDHDAAGGFISKANFVNEDGASRNAVADDWLKKWRFRFAKVGPLCGGLHTPCLVTGLVLQVWTHQPKHSAACDEAAITFRGTDANSLGDWLSNFHFLTRLAPVGDQYEQVQANIEPILNEVRRLPCVTSSTRIVAVGHSLGGGLAQQAAYMSPTIKRVYAFDPSPVTGSEDSHTRYRHPDKWPLLIERVYEHGEVLAYLRFIQRQFVPMTDCDPRVRNFRVNLLHGQPIFQHGMDELATALLDKSGAPYDSAHMQPLPGSMPNEEETCHGEPQSVVAARR